MNRLRLAFVTALTCIALVAAARLARAEDARLVTVAEQSGFRATARHDEVLEFIGQLAVRSPQVRRLDFGTTVEGRELTAIILSKPPVTSPADARMSGKLVALLVGNMHAGECDGKEALLALARDLALTPVQPILDQLILLVVPNFNADGNERMAPNNRPGQIGPDWMGRRENAQGLDLNRDFVKLECPEVQALVRLINEWNPHVYIDCHTTNGSRHRYPLTFASPHNLAAPQGPAQFARDVLLPEVMQRLEAKGLSTFFYGNFDPQHTRWTSYGHEPRYGVEYLGLRGRIAILAESYSYIPYKDRIEATGAFVGECLNMLAEQRRQVTETLDRAARETVAAGLNPEANDRIAIRAKLAPRAEKVVVKGYGPAPSPDANSDDAPQPPVTTEQPKDYTVEHVDRCDPTLDVARPFVYCVPFTESRIADRLRQHGIALEQLIEPISCEVEVLRIDMLDSAATPFQGHEMQSATVSSRRERRELPGGSYIVRTAQPLGNLALYMLEPASDDGLVTWNFFDHLIRPGQDYPVLRVPLPTRLPTTPVDRVHPAQTLDLDQIYGLENKIEFSGSTLPPPRWLPGTLSYLDRSGGRVMRTDAETSETSPFHDAARMEKAFAAIEGISAADACAIASRTSFDLNSDASATIITHASDLFYYHFNDGRAVRLTQSSDPEDHASFSPNGKNIAFVRNHNLFVVDIETRDDRALTTEGNEKLLFGELDWVYQEEVYGRGNFKAYWWSPDSTRIALLRLDESEVKSFTVVDHVPTRQEVEVTPYPKAGDPNPEVALGVVQVDGGPIQWVDMSHYSSDEPLIVRVGWTPDSSRLVYQVQNRAQTWLDLLTADPVCGTSVRLIRETSPGWVEVLGEPQWLKDGSFVWRSDRSGARHLYRVSADGQQVSPLTSGAWDVQELEGIDEANGWVYFTATKDSPAGPNVYRMRLDGSDLTRLSDRPGTHVTSFDDSFRFFFDTWSDAHTPPQTWLCRADGQRLRAIEPNLVDYLGHYRVTRPEFLHVTARDGVVLEAMLIKPPDFDPTKKYPVLCYVYSGPQAPVVRDRWGGPTNLWHQMLAQRGYIIWMCDNRSASTKGISAAQPIYQKLGQHELEDIEDGVKWLKSQTWVDADRIGVWGWSYGGYMAAYALTHSKTFKLGIAGAPVTDWRNYDTIYTERYMGLPKDNPEGYKSSSVVEAADQLHGHLLLLHGTIDDNVHLANTLQFAYALQKAGKPFDMMLYPKNRHGITDAAQMRHMRELMTRFVLERL